MSEIRKDAIIKELQLERSNYFSRDSCQLDGGERTILDAFAKEVGYRGTDTSSLSLSAQFYKHLKKIIDKKSKKRSI